MALVSTYIHRPDWRIPGDGEVISRTDYVLNPPPRLVTAIMDGIQEHRHGGRAAVERVSSIAKCRVVWITNSSCTAPETVDVVIQTVQQADDFPELNLSRVS